jgi:CRISPR/Cas system CMR-associated protein Cmr5 small subunit
VRALSAEPNCFGKAEKHTERALPKSQEDISCDRQPITYRSRKLVDGALGA